MKKWLLIGAVVLIVGIGAYFLFANKSDSNNSGYSSSTNTTNTNSSQSNNETSVANAISISDFAFSPGNITVKKGTTITWTNNDTSAHTVTENDGQSGPASKNLGNGDSYSFTYSNAGTFKYHCSIHTDMTGTVTVTE